MLALYKSHFKRRLKECQCLFYWAHKGPPRTGARQLPSVREIWAYCSEPSEGPETGLKAWDLQGETGTAGTI